VLSISCQRAQRDRAPRSALGGIDDASHNLARSCCGRRSRGRSVRPETVLISAVSYDSQAPIEKTLQSFAVNLTGNPGFGAILGQARGEKVEVTLQQGNAAQPGNVVGSVIG